MRTAPSPSVIEASREVDTCFVFFLRHLVLKLFKSDVVSSFFPLSLLRVCYSLETQFVLFLCIFYSKIPPAHTQPLLIAFIHTSIHSFHIWDISVFPRTVQKVVWREVSSPVPASAPMPAAPCRGQLPCFRFTLPSRSKEQTCVSSEPVFSPGRQGCGGLARALLFSLETSALAKGCEGPRPPAQLRSVRGGVRAAAASPAGGVRPGPSISQGFPAHRCLALSGECCQWLSRSGLAAWKDEMRVSLAAAGFPFRGGVGLLPLASWGARVPQPRRRCAVLR